MSQMSSTMQSFCSSTVSSHLFSQHGRRKSRINGGPVENPNLDLIEMLKNVTIEKKPTVTA
jgi:hypothetical protein